MARRGVSIRRFLPVFIVGFALWFGESLKEFIREKGTKFVENVIEQYPMMNNTLSLVSSGYGMVKDVVEKRGRKTMGMGAVGEVEKVEEEMVDAGEQSVKSVDGSSSDEVVGEKVEFENKE